MPIFTFPELAHATHATLLRHYALHAMPILTFLELAHTTHATLLRHYALHAMPILTFLELAHATHATLLRHYLLHAMPILTFPELARATHATLLRHYALHAMPILTFLELALAHSTHAMLVRAQWNKSAQGGTVSEKSSLTSMLGSGATTCQPRQSSKWNLPKFADKVRCRPRQKRGRKQHMRKHHSSKLNQTQNKLALTFGLSPCPAPVSSLKFPRRKPKTMLWVD